MVELAPASCLSTCPLSSPGEFCFSQDWASQPVGFFIGDGVCSWLCSFEDYCNQYALTELEHLKEVVSPLRDEVCIWHQDMPLESWEE
ncbi:hypothetical protein DSO57_1031897 [Entomophthora muscae]|uniref:Uncharacterized protein n=1 Tax=Entomophthora muscae TaxID=34485 RepID=A0ACC2SPV7_9FUNG|nr:hypothetical protein DSO57_1031897 [Entomophthora muscae]